MGLRQIDRRFEKGTGLRCSPVPFQVLIRMRRVETRWEKLSVGVLKNVISRV